METYFNIWDRISLYIPDLATLIGITNIIVIATLQYFPHQLAAHNIEKNYKIAKHLLLFSK